MCLSSVLLLPPKSSEDILKNLDMSDATTLKHHLTDLIFIMRYEQKQKCRIRYHPFYKTAQREVWNYLPPAVKKVGNCQVLQG
jgi:hypothetical protein